MRISILMPVFNTGPLLRECLDSIIQQAETDWELLAIDDFSTDQSWAILQEYALKDARIRAWKNTAKGIIPALQLAYSKSTGILITRMDSDDRMAPDKLGRLKTQLLQKGAGHICIGLVRYFSESGLGDGYRRYEQWLNAINSEEVSYREIYRECVIPSPCWMVFREDLDRCDAFNPIDYPEDYDLCFRFYEQNLKVTCVREVLHFWRDHPERASRNDPHYADNQYFDLKLPYFLRLDRNQQRPLVLWGAGRKGKRIASLLKQRDIPFRWICNTPSKWGVKINEVILEPVKALFEINRPQVIIAVAGPEDQVEIERQLEGRYFQKGEDYFFFC
jgi:glycosyltransferase involved in cell wall biosynthesis